MGDLIGTAEREQIEQLEASNQCLRREIASLKHLPKPIGSDGVLAAKEFFTELERARKKFPTMASAHEGYAVIREELDELWDIIKQQQSSRDYAAMRKETVQLGAMVLAFLIEIVDTENRR